MTKKKEQLGMNPSTASHRLVKDLLFRFVVEAGHKCFRCGKEMSRDNFSIDHKEFWLDSEDPVGLYFDLSNIAFSHLKCNRANSRCTTKYSTEEERKEARREAQTRSSRKRYTPERRRDQYLRTGK